LEATGRAREVARPPTRNPLGVRLGARQFVSVCLPGFRQRLEDFHRLRSALYADDVELAPYKGRAGQRHGRLRCDDRRTEIFVGTLEPRGDVHHVAHGRIVEAAPGTDVADERIAGIQSDAVSKLAGSERRAGAIELLETPPARERRPHAAYGMGLIIEGRAEHSRDGIADVFVDKSAVLLDVA